MLNMRNQLDKIIITAMDRFVWFILLVVISHLVTEFTRVTGYSRGPRQDVVTANDSSIQPIKVQNLLMNPGQEYGLYEQQNQQYYSASNLYISYLNNNSNNSSNNNFLSSLFNQFTNNNKNGQQQPTPSDSIKSNNLLNMPTEQTNANFFSFRPLIDSIFEIPISTLRAVNNLVRRLTGGYLQPQQQQQHETDQQQQPIKYYAYPSHPSSYSHYGIQRSTNAIPPKSQFEMLNGKQPSSTQAATKPTAASITPLTESVLNNGVQR